MARTDNEPKEASRLRRGGAAALFVLVAVAPVTVEAASAVDEVDLSQVTLDLGDLPDGFYAVPDEVLAGVDSSAKQIGESLEASFEHARLGQYVVYASDDDSEVIEVVVVGPLVAMELAGVQAELADPAAVADDIMPSFAMFVDLGEPQPFATTGIGQISAGFAVESTVTSESAVVSNMLGYQWTESTARFILATRGDYIVVLATQHAGPGDARIDLLAAARHVDADLAAALGLAEPGQFRPIDTFSPEVATNIPTITDISTEPRVVAANLVLAALAVLAMTFGMRLLNTTLVAHEDALEQGLRPARALGRWWKRADDAVSRRGGRVAGLVRVSGVLAFYGVLFSFLEPGWRPWTASGLFVLVAMTIAFGLVGTADDMVELRSAHRWGLPARLAVKPALVLIAVGSVVLTKLAGLVPGLMIGTPEAFSLEDEPDEHHEARLAAVGLGVTAAVGLGAWALAAPVGSAFDGTGGIGQSVLGALVTVLVLVFAVAVENLFANLLAFPGSEGATLRRWSRPAWWACMLAVTALFFHTLINPSGDLAESLESTNVKVVIATVAAFLAATGIIRLVFARRDRTVAATVPLPPPTVTAHPVPPPPPPPPAPPPRPPRPPRPHREHHPARIIRRVTALLLLVGLAAAVTVVIRQRQRDQDLYDEAHAAYLSGDCDVAVETFDELLANQRYVDHADVIDPATLEREQCAALLAIDVLGTSDPPGALLDYSRFLDADPTSPLTAAVTTRSAGLIDREGAAAVATVDVCDSLASLEANGVVPAASAAAVTLECALVYQADGRDSEARDLALEVLDAPDESLAPRAIDVVLGSPSACGVVHEIVPHARLIDQPDRLASFLQGCIDSATAAGNTDDLATLQLTFLSLLPAHPGAPAVEVAMLENISACALMDEVRADPAVSTREGFLLSFTFHCAQVSEFLGNFGDAVEWYQWFVDNAPLEARTLDAVNGLARSTIALARQQGTGELPDPTPTGTTSGGVSRVVIYNDSPEELRIVVSGPESRIEIIPASPTSSTYSEIGPLSCRTDVPTVELRLIPGAYDVLVEAADGGDIADFLGSWDLGHNDVYESCFFVVETFGG